MCQPTATDSIWYAIIVVMRASQKCANAGCRSTEPTAKSDKTADARCGARAKARTLSCSAPMPNPRTADLRIQALVFALVCAAFTSVYVTQPVLPILELEFGVSAASASSTISAVIAGIAIASLPSGWLADRVAIRRLIAIGGAMLVACCVVVAATHSFSLLVAVRFVQGLFVPALTTCIAAYLARSLDARRLNVAMGAYVSATVAGGLGGRLLGGWIHPPLHWRYAFVTTAVLIALATVASLSC